MRITTLLPIIILVACTAQKSDDTLSDSTTVVATDTIPETPTEAVSYTDAEPETESESGEATGLDSAWFNTFTEDPLGHNSYDGVVSYLDGRNIQHRDTVIDMITWVYFGSSSISINVTEAYGDLVCSGFIEDPNYILSSGITPGMSREEFLETTGMSPDAIIGNSFGYTINYDNEEFSYYRTVTFYFDEKSLTGVDYDLSTCVIYD